MSGVGGGWSSALDGETGAQLSCSWFPSPHPQFSHRLSFLCVCSFLCWGVAMGQEEIATT